MSIEPPVSGERPAWSPVLRSIRRVIAVVGCQRSGTTLTGQILGAAPTALLIDEKDGLYDWFHDRTPDDRARARRDHALLERAATKYRDAPRDGIDTLVLKAPNLTFEGETLVRLPVPVHIVYPIRDPRAVVASMGRLAAIDFVSNQRRLIDARDAIAMRLGGMRSIMADSTQSIATRRAAVWRAKSGERATLEGRGLRVFQFRYEDLVADAAVREALLASCGMDGPPAPASHEHVYRGIGAGGTDRERAVDGNSLDTWRTSLSAAEQADVMRTAGALADHFGYA